MARADDWIREGSSPYLETGEHVVAALVAAPRGHTQAVAGIEAVGQRQERGVAEAADQAGFPLEAPMALALTPRRLLALAISNPVGIGIGGKVKGLLGSVPVEDVDSIEVKRLLLGSRITLTVRGSAIKLEAGAGAKAKPLAEAFAGIKAG